MYLIFKDLQTGVIQDHFASPIVPIFDIQNSISCKNKDYNHDLAN